MDYRERRRGYDDRQWRGSSDPRGGAWGGTDGRGNYHDPPPRRGHSRDHDHDHHGGFDDRGRVPEREHRMQSREWDGGRNHMNDRYAPASERMERYGREEDRNGRREHVRRESSRDAFRRSARGDDSARRTSASRKPDYSESDSSETEYTRKPRQRDVTLTPHEQLEALDLWLKANPEVAREVDELNKRASGANSQQPPPFFQDGDWLCVTCKEHNWKNRLDCRTCGAPAPAEKIAEVQAQKARAAVAQAARPQTQSAKAGDWMCVGCMATNYARLNSCHRCSRSKPNEWVCVLCNSMNSGAELTICRVCPPA